MAADFGAVTHRGCGGLVAWKSVLDDANMPSLIPWCPTCQTAVGSDEVDGNVFTLPPDRDEVREHLALTRMSRTWAPTSARLH